jgi:hypothetical protein
MSLSSGERDGQLKAALIAIFEYADGNRSTDVYLQKDVWPYFDSIVNTTWKELEQRGCVTVVHLGYIYRLTPKGWLRGLDLSGELLKPELKEKLGQILRSLKDDVKGREEDGVILPQHVSDDSGVPKGFVENAIDCSLIERVLRRVGGSWDKKSNDTVISIPSNVGHTL